MTTASLTPPRVQAPIPGAPEATSKPARKPKGVGNGRGSVFKRTSTGRWVAQLTWVEPDGRTKSMSKVRDTQREAQDALREIFKERERWTPGGSMALADWLDLWLTGERGHVRPSTLLRYGSVVANLKPLVGSLTLGEVTPRIVDRLCDELAQTFASTTVQLARTVLGVSMKKARRDGHVLGDPVGLSRPVKAVARPVEVLTADQTKVLLAAAAKDEVVGPLVTLLAASGCRIGEAMALRIGDLDLDHGRIRIERTMGADGVAGPPKSERGRRTVSLPSWCTDVLREHLGRQRGPEGVLGASGPLFRDDYGRPWNQSLALRRFHQLLKANGLPEVRLHALRHGHATSLLDGGADVLAVSRRLGHSSIQITSDTYTGTLVARDIDLAHRLDLMR